MLHRRIVKKTRDTKKPFKPMIKKEEESIMKAKISILSPPLFKFLDPIQHYRLSGDMIFTNRVYQTDETIYSFELYRDYKALRQIHVRDNGVVLELEDFNENEIVCTSFLRTRLKTLGNLEASNFADFLEGYDQYFRSSSHPLSTKTQNSMSSAKEDVLEWVDSIFNDHKDDLVFMRGSKILGLSKDFRTKYLCYNFKMLDWITTENNFFSEDFITNCFKIFFFRSINEFTNILRSMTTSGRSNAHVKLPKCINSLIGKIEINVEIDAKFFPQSNQFFHYFIHSAQNFDYAFEQKIQKIQMISKKQVCFKNLEKDKNYSEKYGDLMKLYYLKR